MGTFRIEIEAVGDHGAQRDVGDGGSLEGWKDAGPGGTLDRIAFDAVEQLKAKGASVVSAKIVHWPEQESEVTDDLLAQTRSGSF